MCFMIIMLNLLSQNQQVSLFIQQIESVAIEFKKYTYRNVPTSLLHLESSDNRYSIISHINNSIEYEIMKTVKTILHLVYEIVTDCPLQIRGAFFGLLQSWIY
eukprot:91130_1